MRPRTSRRTPLVVALVPLAFACGSSAPAQPPPPAPSVDAGPDARCPADEPLLGDACVKPGVPPEACGEGFEPDGAGGCRAVLPADPCPAGQIAVPGDRACRPLADCGTGTWGNIPLTGTVRFVDASAPAGGDGTQVKPYRTLAEALVGPPSGATIAVAAGAYVGDIDVRVPGVKLWGRCPQMVEISGTANPTVYVSAWNVEIRGVAVRGAKGGIGATSAKGTIVDRVWVHDCNDVGIAIIDVTGVTSGKITDTLVERTNGSAVLAGGSEIELARVAIRDTAPRTTSGTGIGLIVGPDTRVPSKLTMTQSLVERSYVGLTASGSIANVERSVFRDTAPTEGGEAHGLVFAYADGFAAKGTVRSTVVERARGVGIFASGSTVEVDATTVVDTLRESAARPLGYGLAVQGSLKRNEPAQLRVTRSRVERSTVLGVAAVDAELVAEGVWIGDTRPAADGDVGDGILVWSNFDPTKATVRGARIAKSARAGLSTFGATVDLEATVFDCNRIALDGERVGDRDFALRDLGGSTCGCGAPRGPCAVVTSNLLPPPRAQ